MAMLIDRYPEAKRIMWYFSWILGTGLALTFGILNAMWYEIVEGQREEREGASRAASSRIGS